MLYLFLALVLAFVISFSLLNYSSNGYEGRHTFAGLMGAILAVIAGLTAIFYAVAGWGYVGAEYKADIVNREYGTDYTQQEIFFAGSVIDTIRELDRQRVEVNGDLFREQADPTATDTEE